MNERIRELARQSTGASTIYMLEEEWLKFAELIVRECIECADIVGKANLATAYPNSTAHHVKQKIREHFGVEL